MLEGNARNRHALLTGIILLVCMLNSSPALGKPECNQPVTNPVLKIHLPGRPFEALASPDGCWIFVSLIPVPQSRFASLFPPGIAVLQRNGGKIKLKQVVPLDPPGPAGIVLTHDGKVLIAADESAVAFLDVSRLENRKKNALLGLIRDGQMPGSVYVNVTSDDGLLFVSDERMAQVSVINLSMARQNGFAQSSLVGSIPVGLAPVGLAFSQDNHYLFATSEIWNRSQQSASTATNQSDSAQQSPQEAHQVPWPISCRPELPGSAKALRPEGALSIVSVTQAATDPTHAVLATVPAGCSPVRIEIAPNGETLYITARNSNALLAYDTAKLLDDPSHALIASVAVGRAPVGLTLINNGRTAIVANSSRFGGPGGQTLTVVDLSGSANGKSTVEGTIPAGEFPRELHVTPDGKTLLLTNFGSEELELIDLARMPSLVRR